MSDTTRRPNIDSPARWEAARLRAVTECITVRQDVTGQFWARSSDGARRYRVSWYECSCQAGAAGDPVCKHRAAYRLQCQAEDRAVERRIAELAEPAWLVELMATDPEDGQPDDLLPVDEPTPPARLASGACPDCLDTGYVTFFGQHTTCRCHIGRSRPLGGDSPKAKTRTCSECHDTGIARTATGGRLTDYVEHHCSCPIGRDLKTVRAA